MENLIIKGNQTSPTVTFSIDGKLKIQGRIITDNPVTSFKPLFDWIAELKCKKVLFDIEIDYMNTSASMQLFSILELLESKKEIETLKVNWYYEEDDEDHLETGHIFEQKLDRTEFTYIRLAGNPQDKMI
jgi:hypothetical protein